MPRRWWRLLLGTAAFSLVAPVGFVALPLAALLVATRPAPAIAWGVAVALAALGAWTLLPAPGDRLGTLAAAFAVCAAVAFAGGNLLAPVGLWRQSLRALLWAGAATLGLATVAWRGIAWSELHWEATRKATVGAFAVIALAPGTFSMMEPLVRLLSSAAPVLLALQTLAGLALAWFWHARLDLAPAPVVALADGTPVLPSHT